MRGQFDASRRVTTERFRGAPHTVDNIRRLAVKAQLNYALRELAEEIVGRLPSKDYLSEIAAIHYWVLANCRYANDPRSVELVRSPAEVLARLERHVAQLLEIARTGQVAEAGDARWRPSLDCDDMTALLVTLLLILGREVQIMTVAFRDAFVRGQRQYSHVFVRVREPLTGQWIVLDPVAAEGAAKMLARVRAAHIWPIA